MLMTATPTKQMINDLETLTGLKVNTTNEFGQTIRTKLDVEKLACTSK